MINAKKIMGRKLIATTLVCVLGFLFWVLCPCSCRPVSKRVLEKKEFEKMQLLAKYIEEYKNEYGTVPENVYELDRKNPWVSKYHLITEKNDKDMLKDIKIKEKLDETIIYEVVFFWEKDGFIWAKTNTGDIIKVLPKGNF